MSHNVVQGKKTTYRPLGRKVIVRRFDKKAKSFGGIVLPDTQGEKNLLCELLAIGDGETIIDAEGVVRTVPAVMNSKVGDVVVVRQFAGTAADELDDPDLLIVHGSLIEGTYHVLPQDEKQPA